jgi:hypothetical protein
MGREREGCARRLLSRSICRVTRTWFAGSLDRGASPPGFSALIRAVAHVLVAAAIQLDEPHGHRTCTVTGQVLPTYAAFFHGFGRYYEGDPMTLPEFRAFKRDELPLPP